MGTIIARGYPVSVDQWVEGPPGQTFDVALFRLWCQTDDGKVYQRYVDVAYARIGEGPTSFGWSSDVLDTLYRCQADLERAPDVYGTVTSPDKLPDLQSASQNTNPSIIQGFQDRQNKEWQDVAKWASDFNLPSDPNNPDREHIGGPEKCWCGRTHPPHKPWEADCDKAPVCWCHKQHCGIGFPRKARR